MIIDCVGDLHGHYPQLEGGDLLIVAGDLTRSDTQEQHKEFFEWLDSQDYTAKAYIAGNHDNYYQKNKAKVYLFPLGVVYLEDQLAEFEGLKIWGSPWTRTFEGMNPHCKAFTCDTEEELAEKWKLIPDDVDILVTHSPPFGTMDDIYRSNIEGFENVGSGSLAMAIMDRPKIKVHVFGHVHESHGKKDPKKGGHCIFVNASHVNERYEPVNRPIRVIL